MLLTPHEGSSSGCYLYNVAALNGSSKKIDSVPTCSIAIAANGAYIVAGDRDGGVRQYELPSLKCTVETKEHTDVVHSLAVAPDSKYVASASWDATAIVWSASMVKLHLLAGHKEHVNVVIFLVAELVATAGQDHTIRLWETQTGKSIKVCKKDSDDVNSLALSPNHMLYVSGSSDKTVKIFNAATFECIKSVKCDGEVLSVCFADDNTILAGIWKNGMAVIDATTGLVNKVISQFETPRAIVATPTKIRSFDADLLSLDKQYQQ